MTTPNHGWFDAVAAEYARRRPVYPEAFFAWMANQAPARRRCWDAACGNGQASVGLASWFDQVDATDISPKQIAMAEHHPRVHYRVGSAEQSDLRNRSVDAVLVAAAIHWLNVERFNQEVHRVLRPGGLLVWLGYDPIEGAPADLQDWLERLYHERLREMWPPERTHVDLRYSDLNFPVPDQSIPHGLRMTVHWSKDDLLGFISTWSALRRPGRQAGSSDHQPPLVESLSSELTALWPRQTERLQLHFPLMGRWGVWPDE